MARQTNLQLPGRLRSVAVRSIARRGRVTPAELGEMQGQAELQQAREELERDRQRLALACQAVAKAAGQLQQAQAALAAEAEEQLRGLAVEIARKVLVQEVQAGRYEIDPIVAEAMRHVPSRRNVVVHLHPDDYAQCEMARQLAEDSDGIRFVADPNLQPAECILETSEGVVESSVEANLQSIDAALQAPE
jgi:flagellar assembly protein FliH